MSKTDVSKLQAF